MTINSILYCFIRFIGVEITTGIDTLSVLSPVQTENVWRLNTIKHCLVTKHVDVESSGQTVSNMFDQRALESKKQAISMDTSETACPERMRT